MSVASFSFTPKNPKLIEYEILRGGHSFLPKKKMTAEHSEVLSLKKKILLTK
jgi:hypothetical protein